MEILSLLLLIVLLIVIISFKNSVTEKLDYLQYKVLELNDKIAKQKNLEMPTSAQPKPVEQKPIVPPAPIQTDNWQSGFRPMDEGAAKPKEDEKRAAAFDPPIEKPLDKSLRELLEQHDKQFAPTPPAAPKPTFFERNPDLEKFIGENLISKIGIGILVLAIGFFVKYAIDNNWIGEVGRVSIGLVCGGILVGLAHRLRNSYKAFSSVLVGGGLAVFYFTMTLAHQRFHLFGNTSTIAFIIMIAITAFAVAISLLYDRQELAIISLVGGFLSPFLVSDGNGNFHALFIYLIILNAGLLIIAYNKAWRLLNLLAFIFTIIIFAGWLLQPRYIMLEARHALYTNGLAYASVFYLLFFAINIANNIKENKKFIASDFGILLTNTATYFGAGLYCIYEMDAVAYKGLFSASMGMFNLIASYLLFRKQKVDTNILYLLVGITLTFVSLTAPLQLHGNHITLFWASETVLLFWLYQKSRIRILQLSTLVIWIAMVLSLVMDWFDVYGWYPSSWVLIVFNKAFVTTVYSAAATYMVLLLLKKEQEEKTTWLPAVLFKAAFLLLLFVGGALEVYFQFLQRYPSTYLNTIYLLLYTTAFVLATVIASQKMKPAFINAKVKIGLLYIAIVGYFIGVHNTYFVQGKALTQNGVSEVISKTAYNNYFMGHWVTAILVAIALFQIITLVKRTKVGSIKNPISVWILCIVTVAFLSVEAHLLMNALFYSASNPLLEIERVYIKTGLPILWGLCSFAFMWLGMKHKYRILRIISLSLFSITLLKLFLFDISNIPIAGKIAAFFCLGVILLVVSFMYQRLKKIIIDDEKKNGE